MPLVFILVLRMCSVFLHDFQAAQFQAEQAGNMCRRLLKCNNNTQLLAEQSLKETRTTEALLSFVPGTVEQSAPVMFTRQVSFPEKPGHIEEDPRKSAAAAVAAKLIASTRPNLLPIPSS